MTVSTNLMIESLTVADKAAIYYFYHQKPELYYSAYRQATNELIKKVIGETIGTNEDEIAHIARKFEPMTLADRKEWLVSQFNDRALIDSLLVNTEYAQAFRDSEQSKVAVLPVTAKVRPTEDLKLEQMKPSQRASLLLERLHPLAVNDDQDMLYHYTGTVWEKLTKDKAAREMVAIYNEHDTPYSQTSIYATIDALKLQAHIMGEERQGVIAFKNGVYDIHKGEIEPHSPDNWLLTHNGIEYTAPEDGETLETHAPFFVQWLDHSSGIDEIKASAIKAALYMILTNRHDWQLFIEVTGQGGSGKSVFATIASLLAGERNIATGNMKSLDDPQGRANLVNRKLILLPDQSKYVGDGNGIKAITGGDSVEVNPKYEKQFSTVINAVVMAINNEPMSFTERQGGVSRRRVIFCFNNVVNKAQRDPKLVDKIKKELPVIVRHLLAEYESPIKAKIQLEAQQESAEAMEVKQQSDPLYAFCGYLVALEEEIGMMMGTNTLPRKPRTLIYHAYLEYLEAHGFHRPLSVTALGKSLPSVMSEYGRALKSKRTKRGKRYNVNLNQAAEEWLPQGNSDHE